MEGVTVLNQFIHEGAIIEPWFSMGLIALGIGMVSVLFGFIFEPKLKTVLFRIVVILGGMGLIMGLGTCIFAPREEEVRYQVTINDSISFNDFIERYEIIKQDGYIFTIQEREP